MRLDRKTMPAVAAALLLALGVAGCATDRGPDAEPKRTATQTVSDAAITAKVKTLFAADEVVKAHKINVDTVQGVVTLNGVVRTDAEKQRAMDIARRADGVRSVRDNIKVGG